jgi:hypothetical protein
MSWDYRVVRRTYRKEDGEVLDVSYFIVEAFYDENDKVFMITQEPEGPFGDNISELMNCWVMLAEAFNKPILDWDNIPEEGAHNEIEERIEELQDDNGKMRPEEELIEEGKLIPHNVVMEDLIGKMGKTREEWEVEMQQFRKDQEQERLDNETSYVINYIGQPIPVVIGQIIENWVNSQEDPENS